MKITCRIASSDFKLFSAIVNQGIDAHLEAFTESKFFESEKDKGRFVFDFAKSELPILLRRLRELETEEGDQWADDIEEADKQKDDDE